jgi:hypothetical protein
MKTSVDLNAHAKPVRLPVYRGKGGLASGMDGLNNKVMLAAADRASSPATAYRPGSQRSGTRQLGQ